MASSSWSGPSRSDPSVPSGISEWTVRACRSSCWQLRSRSWRCSSATWSGAPMGTTPRSRSSAPASWDRWSGSISCFYSVHGRPSCLPSFSWSAGGVVGAVSSQRQSSPRTGLSGPPQCCSHSSHWRALRGVPSSWTARRSATRCLCQSSRAPRLRRKGRSSACLSSS